MDKIEVTDEMRERILENIADSDLSRRKQPFFIRYKAYFAAAACFALMIAGVAAMTHFSNPGAVIDGNPPVSETSVTDVQVVYDAVECNSAEELSELLGFEVKEPDTLPFEYDSVTYTSLWGKYAEICWYSGENRAASFDTAPGNEDISGDYNEYADVREIDINGVSVTIKGSSGNYCAAVWTNENRSYALLLEKEITEEQIAEFVRAVTV